MQLAKRFGLFKNGDNGKHENGNEPQAELAKPLSIELTQNGIIQAIRSMHDLYTQLNEQMHGATYASIAQYIIYPAVGAIKDYSRKSEPAREATEYGALEWTWVKELMQSLYSIIEELNQQRLQYPLDNFLGMIVQDIETQIKILKKDFVFNCLELRLIELNKKLQMPVIQMDREQVINDLLVIWCEQFEIPDGDKRKSVLEYLLGCFIEVLIKQSDEPETSKKIYLYDMVSPTQELVMLDLRIFDLVLPQFKSFETAMQARQLATTEA